MRVVNIHFNQFGPQTAKWNFSTQLYLYLLSLNLRSHDGNCFQWGKILVFTATKHACIWHHFYFNIVAQLMSKCGCWSKNHQFFQANIWDDIMHAMWTWKYLNSNLLINLFTTTPKNTAPHQFVIDLYVEVVDNHSI